MVCPNTYIVPLLTLTTMKALCIICIVIAFVAMGYFMSLAEGVPHQIFAVAVGCFWLILGRMAQARSHMDEIKAIKTPIFSDKTD